MQKEIRCENCKNEKTCHFDWHYKGRFDEFVDKCEYYENKNEKQVENVNSSRIEKRPYKPSQEVETRK